MKKLFTSLILLMVGVFLSSAYAEGSIKILGKSYTSGSGTIKSADNSAITNDGSIAYKFESSGSVTLTLTDVTVQYTGVIIESTLDKNVTINCSGWVELTSTSNNCFDFSGKGGRVFINGTGGIETKLTLNGKYAPLRFVPTAASELYFMDIYVTIKRDNTNGIYGGENGQICFHNSYVHITKGSSDTIYGLAYVWPSSGFFQSPSNVTYNRTAKTLQQGGSAYTGELYIYPNLWVGGKFVSTLSDAAAGPGWKWDKASKTVTISGDITTSGAPVVRNANVEGLTINVSGTDSRTLTSSMAPLILDKNTTITGGTLNLKTTSSTSSGILVNGGTTEVTIQMTELNCVGNSYGFMGERNGTLTLKKPSSGGCVYKFAGSKGNLYTGKLVYLEYDVDLWTASSWFNESKHYMYHNSDDNSTSDIATTSNGPSSGTWFKEKSSFTYYPIYVAGTQVNSRNYSNILNSSVTAGQISYDKSSTKLTLNKVTLTTPSDNNEAGIKMKPSTYVSEIVLEGENNITTVGDAIRIYGDGTISGSGELYATSTSEGALSMFAANSKASLTLNCKTVKAKGKKFGFWGNSQSCTSNLILKNDNGKAWYVFNGEEASVGYATDIQMPTGVKGIDFYKGNGGGTAGCYFDDGFVRQNGGSIVKGSDVICVYIDYDYGITVAGVPVTDCNEEGIGSKYITSGGATAVTYNSDSGTLSLNNATINTGNANCALKYTGLSNDITINVTGNCEFKQPSGWVTTYLGGNTTIKGSGTLTVNGELGSNEGKSMTFDNVNIKAGKIISQSSKPSKLYVSLTTKGKTVSATDGIFNWGTIYLQNGTKVVKPDGAKLSDDYTSVVTSSGARATNVVLGDKTVTGIDGIEADANAEVIGIFDAQGRQLNEMQPGVNIIRMSDGTTKKVVVK